VEFKGDFVSLFRSFLENVGVFVLVFFRVYAQFWLSLSDIFNALDAFNCLPLLVLLISAPHILPNCIFYLTWLDEYVLQSVTWYRFGFDTARRLDMIWFSTCFNRNLNRN
jgi:hypothetical protein